MSALAQRRLQSANRNLLIVTLCCLLIAVFAASGRAGATTYTYQITIPGATSGTVNERSGPGTSYSIVGTLSDGTSIQIACQTMGTNVDGTSVWDQLASNDYISDYYTNTPVSYGFSPPIPMCGSTTTTSSPPNSIPSATSYQITIPGATNGSVNERSGPGTSYSIVGTMGDGTGIQIACQTSGTDVNGTSVWDQLSSNDYISDYYTNTPTVDGFTSSIPQCTSVPTIPAPTASVATYRVTIPRASSGTVNERSGPGTNFSVVSAINDGTNITIACQTSGTDVSGTSVWDQLASNDYISDYYTNTPTVDGFTSSIPQCTSVPTIPSTPTAPTSSWSPLHGQTVSTNPFNESGYCTWYAEVRFHDYVINFPSAYPANNSYIDVTGNAKLWATSAQKHGWTVTTTPTVNSIVVFQPGENGVTNSAGHVAWVTAVNGSHFTVLELNDVLANGAANTGFAPDRNPYYHAGSGVSFILIPT